MINGVTSFLGDLHYESEDGFIWSSLCFCFAVLQYSASVPQFIPSYQPAGAAAAAAAAGYINAQQQAVMAASQHVRNITNNQRPFPWCSFVSCMFFQMGQKFVGDMSPQHQVFAGTLPRALSGPALAQQNFCSDKEEHLR